ncbi:hypothetical protein TKK_0013503 [Trichogramma kaykai]
MYLCFLDICSSTSKPVGSRKQSRTLTIVCFRLSALKSKRCLQINIEACLKKKTKPNDNHRLPPDVCSSTSKPVGSRRPNRTITIVCFRLSALKSKINIEACLKKKTKPNDNHRLPPGKCLKVKVFFADPTNVLMFSRCLQLNVEACWKQKTKQNNNYRLLPAECLKVQDNIMQINIEACLKKKTKPNDNYRLPPGKCLKVKVFFADPTNVLMFSRCLQLNVEACWKQKTKQNNNYRCLPAECFKVKGIIMQVQQCFYASPMHSAQRQSLLEREDEAKR